MQLTGKDNVSEVIINRGFRQVRPAELSTFTLNGEEHIFTGIVQFNICLDENCTAEKEFEQRRIDTRSQAIFTKRCVFYKVENSDLCETREN